MKRDSPQTCGIRNLHSEKKAQSEGLWIPALMLFFIFTMLFLFLMVSINSGKIIIGKEDSTIEIRSQAGTDPTLQKNFLSFLNKKPYFEEETILEIIENSEISQEKKQEIFELDASLFFDEIFPFPSEFWNGAHPYWVKVYEKKDEIGKADPYVRAGYENCNPFEDSSITLTYYTKNKKIALCVLKEYYETIQNIPVK